MVVSIKFSCISLHGVWVNDLFARAANSGLKIGPEGGEDSQFMRLWNGCAGSSPKRLDPAYELVW